MADDLVILVAFAREEDDVARLRVGDYLSDRGGSVEYDLRVGGKIRGEACEYIIDDGLWRFVAWVVGGDDDVVGEGGGGLRHAWAFGGVTVTAAAEKDAEFVAREGAE